MIRIVHLSDLHFTADNLIGDKLILNPLVKDIKKYNSNNEIDAIVISGDNIHRGGEGFGSADEAFRKYKQEVIEKLEEAVDIQRGKLIIVPGNHDIDRSLDSEILETGLYENLDSEQKVDEFIENGLQEGVERIGPYNNFEKDIYSEVEYVNSRTSLESTFSFCHEEYRINIAALNSSWRCYSEEDYGRLITGKRQILRACDNMEDSDVSIAVMHHPVDYLREFDKNEVIHALRQNFDILLCGHVHHPEIESTRRVSGGIFISTSPGQLDVNTLGESTAYENGYQILDIDPEKWEIEAHLRRYSSNTNEFVLNTSMGGTTTWRLPTDESVVLQREEEEIAEHIDATHSERMDEDLITYGTDTDAPTALRDIFVMPEVVFREDESSEREFDKEYYDLEDIASTEDNLFIHGREESGKTILLERLCTYLSDNIIGHRQVPVYIDFQSMGNGKIKSEVSHFLGIPTRDVESFAKRHRLSLLVDDISFSNNDKRRLSRLKQFLNKFELSRVIITYTQERSGELPVKALEYIDDLELTPLNILGFKSKQIRKLASKWFPREDIDSGRFKLDDIVSLFSSLDIPHTPLAVSMFFWIIEKQETYRPTNEASMVENFIERMFKKHSVEEIYSETFDYKNKESLLCGISKFMLDEGGEDYGTTYDELLIYCRRHIEDREFDFNPKEILDHFINVGIFTREQDKVKFRFRCFFEYFVAKNMQYDDEFEAFVLHVDNYLEFPNEVKYITGLERTRVDILERLLERLDKATSSTVEILEAEGDFDEIFSGTGLHLDAIDKEKLIGAVESGEPSDSDVDEMRDKQLVVSQDSEGIQRKNSPESHLERFGRLLSIVAVALKNTEETTKSGLKSSAYAKILRAALAYGALYRSELRSFLDKRDDDAPDKFIHYLEFIDEIMPIFLQLSLHNDMGTKKLKKVMRNHIEGILKNKQYSDIEKFISVFIYADIQGERYKKYITDAISEINNNLILNNIFFKTVSYLYLRSNSRNQDDKFLDLIAESIVEIKDLNPSDKGEIIQKYRDKKLLVEEKGSKSQMTLDM